MRESPSKPFRDRTSRRRFLQGAVASGAGLVAGCTSGDDEPHRYHPNDRDDQFVEWVAESTRGAILGVSDDRIYAPWHPPDGAERSIVALDIETGERDQDFRPSVEIIESVEIDGDGRLFARTADETVVALDAESGSRVWEFEEVTGPISSPVVEADGIVYVTSQNQVLYAVDGDDGDLLWTYDDVVSYRRRSTPDVGDDTIFVQSDRDRLAALDASSGEQQWDISDIGSIRWPPTSTDGTLYVGASDAAMYALDEASGELLWEQSTSLDRQSRPRVVEDTVLVTTADDAVSAVNAQTGETEWSYDDLSDPTVRDTQTGTTYVTDRSGIHAIDITTGEVRWEGSTPHSVEGVRAVDDLLYVSGTELPSDVPDVAKIDVLEADSGDTAWTFWSNPADSAEGSPRFDGDRVISAFTVDGIHAFSTDIET
ncbi:PQQ-like beta-propeller repeat protein [Halobacteria archaeon AArc-dxtr1]|nr:PQQ-like beta-propeller repeat protein [Halobacteria archaeon AArc-dxtr1]